MSTTYLKDVHALGNNRMDHFKRFTKILEQENKKGTDFIISMSQKFYNIFVVHEAQFNNSKCFYPDCEGDKSQLNCEMPSSPDTLEVVLARFAWMDQNPCF